MNVIGRLPLSARVGLALILLPIAGFGVWACWNATRIWVPLDVPVSLSPGHIQTPEFKINVESTYSIGIATDWPWDFDRACLIGVVRCAEPSVLAASWAQSGGGRKELRGDSADHEQEQIFGTDKLGRVLGRFNADPGRYVLDLYVTQDGSRLNAGAPHLVVFELGEAGKESDEMPGFAAFLFVLFSPVGTFLLVRSVIWRRQEELSALARANSLTQPWPQFPASLAAADAGTSQIGAAWHLQGTSARLTASVYARTTGARLCPKPGQSKKPAFAKMSWYGLMASLCFLVIAMPVCVVVQAQFHVVRMGLRVHLLKPGVSGQVVPGVQPICVRLAPPSLYVDGQSVPWEDFETVLRKTLKLRPPSWPVYLDGDPNMEWGWAVRAIDRIRGLQAEVVLLARPTTSSHGQSRSRRTRSPAGTLQPGQR